MSQTLIAGNQTTQNLEEKWLEKASLLGTAQLDSPTWNDLYSALDAAQEGRTSLVARWLDSVEESFISTWESYEKGDVIDEEITTESVLCHRFLLEGVEAWLGAIAEFKETLTQGVDRRSILEQAEAGQRLLVLVELLNQEAEAAMNRFLSWARN